jgi:hypothetical protein
VRERGAASGVSCALRDGEIKRAQIRRRAACESGIVCHNAEIDAVLAHVRRQEETPPPLIGAMTVADARSFYATRRRRREAQYDAVSAIGVLVVCSS